MAYTGCPHSQGESHGLNEREQTMSHLSSDSEQMSFRYLLSTQKPKSQTERQDVLEGPEQSVYTYVARVQEAGFNLLVGLGEISGAFNTSQQFFDLLPWMREESDQC